MEGTGGDRSDTYGDKDGNPEVGEGQARNGKAEGPERKRLRIGAEGKEREVWYEAHPFSFHPEVAAGWSGVGG